MLVTLTVAGPVQDTLRLEGVALIGLDAGPELWFIDTVWIILGCDVKHLLELVSVLGGKGAPVFGRQYSTWQYISVQSKEVRCVMCSYGTRY
jgi:hypothetical protein